MENTAAASARAAEHVNGGTAQMKALGFWIYMMSDLVLFAALFATFAVVGRNYAGGPTGKELFDLPYLFGETLFLLLGSTVCGLTVSVVRGDNRGLTVAGLGAAFLLGLGFISMEIYEFHGFVLGGNGPERSAFLSAFFALVGTHGAHVSFALIFTAVFMGQVFVKGLNPSVRSRLGRLTVFWHFLDIVWIGIFTIVYLMGVI